jgi:ubiquinone/menaquinone biosynthesis C-methylase UbiE
VGAAAHLGIQLADYDRRIRTFIPHYEEAIDIAAGTIAPRHAGRRGLDVTDLGTGTRALAARVLAAVPQARITGIDADAAILGVARRRLRGRLTTVVANFLTAPIAPTDAITASFALHHVPTRRRKAAFYARCRHALRSGGVFVNADCALASSHERRRRDRAAWIDHLRRSYPRTRAEAFLRAWAREDVYFTLDEEIRMLRAAGFMADVVWRRDSFAVVVGTRR